MTVAHLLVRSELRGLPQPSTTVTSAVTVTTLITDLDNTLYDWLQLWYTPFKAMLDAVLATSGLELPVLLKDIRKVHQRHGTSEYTFLLEELDALRILHPDGDINQIYGSAIDAYVEARAASMILYDGVEDTLQHIKEKGCRVVAYTESTAYHTNYRIRKLNLDGLLDILYSNPDYDLPDNVDLATIRSRPPSNYELRDTEHRHTAKGTVKPNADVLRGIIKDVGGDVEHTIYVGDSLLKDIHMANQANVKCALARYGAASDRPEYDLLRSVSHWSDDDIERERVTLAQAGDIQPTVSIESFRELLLHFDFAGA